MSVGQLVKDVLVVPVAVSVAVPAISTSEIREVFATGRYSVAEFWRASSAGALNLRFEVAPWARTTITLPVGGGTRAAAIAALEPIAIDPARKGRDFDAYVLIVAGYGLGMVLPGGKVIWSLDETTYGNTVLMSPFMQHDVICHEVFHAIGFPGHSHGPNGAIAGTTTYGDPYSIMSAAHYGGASCVFDDPGGVVTSNAPAWSRHIGPLLSRAELHWHLGSYADARLSRVVTPTELVTTVFLGGKTLGVNLRPPGPPTATPQLIVLDSPSPDGRGRVYVEYRVPPPEGGAGRWDAGLPAGAPHSTPGLVVHALGDASDDRPGTTEVHYVGHLPVPGVDEDLVVPTAAGPVVLSILGADASRDDKPPVIHVRIRAAASAPAVALRFASLKEDTVVTSEPRQDTYRGFSGTFQWETRTKFVSAVVAADVSGLGTPTGQRGASDVVVDWIVGGTQVASGFAGTATCQKIDGTSVIVQVDASVPGSLALSTFFPIKLAVEVRGRARDAAGATALSPALVFESGTVSEGWDSAHARWVAFVDRMFGPRREVDLVPKPRNPGDPPEQWLFGLEEIERWLADLRGDEREADPRLRRSARAIRRLRRR
jgi:hypothetical protein